MYNCNVVISIVLSKIGFATDGEFNSFRVHGYKRPISIFQIKSNARAKYSLKGESSLLAMLTPIREFEK